MESGDVGGGIIAHDSVFNGLSFIHKFIMWPFFSCLYLGMKSGERGAGAMA